jgi:hypothetical protein
MMRVLPREAPKTQTRKNGLYQQDPTVHLKKTILSQVSGRGTEVIIRGK